jgi:hypothetical protein
VPYVDALPTAVRLAAVAGESNAQGTGPAGGSHKVTPVFEANVDGRADPGWLHHRQIHGPVCSFRAREMNRRGPGTGGFRYAATDLVKLDQRRHLDYQGSSVPHRRGTALGIRMPGRMPGHVGSSAPRPVLSATPQGALSTRPTDQRGDGSLPVCLLVPRSARVRGSFLLSRTAGVRRSRWG